MTFGLVRLSILVEMLVFGYLINSRFGVMLVSRSFPIHFVIENEQEHAKIIADYL